MARNIRTKEREVFAYLRDIIEPSLHPVFDKLIAGGCSFRRPDCHLDLGVFTLVVENDENEHLTYECENKRMMQIFQDSGSRPLVMLRFNPDSFTDAAGVRHPSCFGVDKNGVLRIQPTRISEWRARLETLGVRVRHWIAMARRNEFPSREITVEHLFFTA
jgi:hypothetical protein